MGQLLVSVRSAHEASCAIRGGASIIDVKDPSKGSLGRARPSVWRAVRAAVPAAIPVSAALGELYEWAGRDRVTDAFHDSESNGAWNGLSFVKLGLAQADDDWRSQWRDLAHELGGEADSSPIWVAVCYVDWRMARAPDPDTVIETAQSFEFCRGVLFDTCDKSAGEAIDLSWRSRIERVRSAGRFVAIAGSLSEARIEQLAELEPDIWAVRGAACVEGRRLGPIDPERVARLAAVVERVGQVE